MFNNGSGTITANMVGNLHLWRQTINGVISYLTGINRNDYTEGNNGQEPGYTLSSIIKGSNNLFGWNTRHSAQSSILYSSNVNVDSSGNVSLTSQTRFSDCSENGANSANSTLKNKFFVVETHSGSVGQTSFANNTVYYIPNSATFSYTGAYGHVVVTEYQNVIGHGYIQPTEYTDYIGLLGESHRTVIGSYIGDGANYKTLSFNFTPSFIFGIGVNGSNNCIFSTNSITKKMYVIRLNSQTWPLGAQVDCSNYSNTISWDTSIENNVSGKVYCYIAFE